MDCSPAAVLLHPLVSVSLEIVMRCRLTYVILLASLLAAPAASAQSTRRDDERERDRRSEAPARLIFACVNRSNGQLRIVNAEESCAPSETKVSWPVAATQGPKGETGAAGPAGPQGPQGAAAHSYTSGLVSFVPRAEMCVTRESNPNLCAVKSVLGVTVVDGQVAEFDVI